MGVPRSPLFHRFSASTTKHGVFHDLPTFSGPRVFAKAHHLDPGKLASSWRKQVLFHVLLLLGHSASSSGSAPLHKHVSAITAFPPPANHPALQRFQVMVNFYRKFIHGAALIPCSGTYPGASCTFSMGFFSRLCFLLSHGSCFSTTSSRFLGVSCLLLQEALLHRDMLLSL